MLVLPFSSKFSRKDIDTDFSPNVCSLLNKEWRYSIMKNR